MRFTLILAAMASVAGAQPISVTIEDFPQQIRTAYTAADGLPSDDVQSIAISEGRLGRKIYAGTAEGLAVYSDESWEVVSDFAGAPISTMLGVDGPDGALAVSQNKVIALASGQAAMSIPKDVGSSTVRAFAASPTLLGHDISIAADSGFYRVTITGWDPDIELGELMGAGALLADVATSGRGADHQIVIASDAGLFLFKDSVSIWERVLPSAGNRSWAPVDVRGVAYDSKGRLWFASPQGVGRYDGEWTLFTGAEGLPFNDFTCVAAGNDGDVWFGTTKGAIRFDGAAWEYRQGKRWLPNDEVRAIAVDDDGGAWIATAGGVAHIESVPMTLAKKADHYQYELEHYIKRTPYGYTAEASVATPGDPSEIRNHDSDNDGLWTAMYGAGECFAYGATKSPESKARARAAFEALEFLGTVTRGGSHEPPYGYVARTILPTSGPNPNDGRIERDRESQKSETLWKVYEPRWPTSADGEWYWKSDTSSDELDGHYFFYPLYYDLVADTTEEKARVRKHIKALTDHLIDHDFFLVDHDGKPTRWGHYSPSEMNHDKDWWVERGLNSLSMLSYLSVTAHITGDNKYREIAQALIDDHGYAQNVMVPKIQRGIGTGNQSDDEMAFMCFYNIIKYEQNPELKSRYALAFWTYWRLQLPELNPFFNFCYPAVSEGMSYTDPWGTHDISPSGEWLNDAIDSLKRFPLDRYNWAHTNDHRIDIEPMPRWTRGFDEGPPTGRGYRVNGKVLPVDERHFNHWNTDPYRLNMGGDGRGLGSGAVYTLAYYMGLYHGFIKEEGI
jgi:hypothetical protein